LHHAALGILGLLNGGSDTGRGGWSGRVGCTLLLLWLRLRLRLDITIGVISALTSWLRR
jgi:hypothetical protein